MFLKRDMLALKLESDRMIYLDLLRIASSYLIILYHFQNQMSLGQYADAVRSRFEGLTLSVDLFFFISGFVISSVYSGRVTNAGEFGQFMWKRAARILPLHWATFAVFGAFGILNAMGHLPSNHPEIYDPGCVVPNLLLLHAFGPCSSLTFNYVSWSISAEMGMYLLFPLLAVVAARRTLSLLVVAALIVLLTVVSNRPGWSWLEWSFDLGVLRALPTFLLGVISFHHRALLGRIPWAAGWLLVALLAFLAGCLLQCPKLLLLPLVYAIGALGIAASEQPASRTARRLAPLGQLTYSLYMLHPLVQTVLLTGVGATFLKLQGVPMTLFVVAAMVLMLPIAWLSLVLFERPVRRWLTRWLGKRGSRTEPAMFTPDSRW
jgi:peptidoglycan/LPS O-acetylase OafA/YrhL